jgi:ankyrin repeat protein
MQALTDKLKRSLLQTASSTEPGKSVRLQKLIDTYQQQIIRPQAAGRPDIEREMMRQFLDWQDESGSSALINASCFGNREICYLLLANGASVDLPDRQGWTPLIWATNNGYDEIVKLLLSSGASATVQMAGQQAGMTVGGFLSRAMDPHSRMAEVLGEEGVVLIGAE